MFFNIIIQFNHPKKYLINNNKLNNINAVVSPILFIIDPTMIIKRGIPIISVIIPNKRPIKFHVMKRKTIITSIINKENNIPELGNGSTSIGFSSALTVDKKNIDETNNNKIIIFFFLDK